MRGAARRALGLAGLFCSTEADGARQARGAGPCPPVGRFPSEPLAGLCKVREAGSRLLLWRGVAVVVGGENRARRGRAGTKRGLNGTERSGVGGNGCGDLGGAVWRSSVRSVGGLGCGGQSCGAGRGSYPHRRTRRRRWTRSRSRSVGAGVEFSHGVVCVKLRERKAAGFCGGKRRLPEHSGTARPLCCFKGRAAGGGGNRGGVCCEHLGSVR